MLLIFICGWSASDRTGVAGAAASRDVRVILTAVTLAFLLILKARSLSEYYVYYTFPCPFRM